MCGIAGWVDYDSRIDRQEQVAREMSETLRPRGPDESGHYREEHVWLLHRRLAVMDPAHGKQPMTLESGGTSYRMVYNGELYNTPELRRELKGLGHVFKEHSDTEVLLHAYAQWGVDCLQRLNGIYAFAVWDQREQKLFLARDRMGVKPLFFYPLGDGVIFGSQLKTLLAHPAVRPEIDENGLRELFFLGPGRSGGNGVFRGVRELKPAHFAVLEKGAWTERRYWSLQAREHRDDLGATVQTVRELLLDAIRRQTVADVPLCCFLSGGLDSSLITKVAAQEHARQGKPLTTYSVDYQDNEKYFQKSLFQPNMDSEYIAMMSRDAHTEHRSVTLDNDALAQALPAAALARDLPGMADIDSSLLLFCREIRRDFPVGISGECADEIFGGYPWFHHPEMDRSGLFPWAPALKARERILRPGAVTGGEEYVRQQYSDTVASVPLLAGEDETDRHIRRMTVLNLDWFMQTLLDRKDRMSMAYGLEVRVPFCDHRIVEYAYNMPWSFKALDGREKGIVRKAVEDLLPADIVWRKKSPYPKTHNPRFLELVAQGARDIRKDTASPLGELIDWSGVEELIEHPDSMESNWYGQLMRTPQTLAYLVQMHAWFRAYGVKIV